MTRSHISQLHLTFVPGLALLVLISLVDFTHAYQSSKKRDLIGQVNDSNGEPIANARIVVGYKSWPNNRFRLKTYASKTNDEGKFVFKKMYYLNQPSEFLVTVVADGHAMVSDYVENQSGKETESLEFVLNKAIEKTIVINPGGTPLKKARVFAKTRTTKDGDQHFIYPASSSKLTLVTDEDGKVKMNIFQPGDEISIGLHRKGQIANLSLTINEHPEQAIREIAATGSSAQDKIVVQVTDSNGKAVADANVLVSHKTWPNNRFTMRAYHGASASDGSYTLPDAYDDDGQNGILVSVLAEGQLMQSQYVQNRGGALEPFEFKLGAAKSRKFRFEMNGKPLSMASVLPVTRKGSDGNQHLIYPLTAQEFTLKTDANGELEMPYFDTGDEIELMIQSKNGAARVSTTVEDTEIQTVAVKKKIAQ